MAVYKFSSCDGCQLSLLNLEDELLDLASAVDISYFLEATRTVKPGPYDVGIVEGSITTPHEAERIKEVRPECKFLIALGTCATAGGIQALRNFANADEYAKTVYAHPEYLQLPGEIHLHRRECPGGLGDLGLPGQQVHGGGSDCRPAPEPPAEFPAQPGLPGMQTPRHRLRGGGPGHPLPGTGGPRRLWGAVSRQRARLLRLLRPVQRWPISAPWWKAWCRATATRTRPPACCAVSAAMPRLFQAAADQALKLSAEKENQMNTIEVPALARVEGEGGLYIGLKDGQAVEIRLDIYEPPRFFEGFLVGRYLQEVPDITARICGICPVAYQMSSVTALEKALGMRSQPAGLCPAPPDVLRRIHRKPRPAHLPAAGA